MDPLVLCAIVLIFAFIGFAAVTVVKRSRKHPYPPGPLCLPIIGHETIIQKLSRKLGGVHLATLELAKMYNTNVLGMKTGGTYSVIVFKEELIREVFKRDEFQGRPDNFFIRLRSMGTKRGITMTDGPLWEEQRMFLVKHMHDLGFGTAKMNDLIEDELKCLLSGLDFSRPINLSEHLSKRVLNVLWTLAAGSKMEQEEVLPKLLQSMKERAKAFDITGGLLSQMPWLRFLAPEKTGYNLVVRMNQQISSLILSTIDSHKQTYDKNVTRDFIDAFLHRMYEETGKKTTFTDIQLVMVCLDLFIAGSQTTTHTLDFAIMQIINYPHIQEKVHAEIDSILKPDELPTVVHRTKMPYVQAVLLEAMRMIHVVQVAGPRRVLADTTLGGYFIPKNTTVLMNMTSIMKDTEKWYDPYSFRPERFLTATGELNDIKFYPFGYGKRRCPGEALARNFVYLLFTGLLHQFRLTVPKGYDPPSLDPIPGITLTPRPYMVKLDKRYT